MTFKIYNKLERRKHPRNEISYQPAVAEAAADARNMAVRLIGELLTRFGADPSAAVCVVQNNGEQGGSITLTLQGAEEPIAVVVWEPVWQSAQKHLHDEEEAIEQHMADYYGRHYTALEGEQ